MLALLLTTSFAAQSHDKPATVKLAWDANLDATAGYRVRVGLQSGVYNETYEVGRAVSFEYVAGASGRRYFFVVVAYDANGRESPASNEVSIVAGAVGRSATLEAPAGSHVPHDQSLSNDPATREANSRPGVVTSLAVLPDGRALFIEDTHRVRIFARGAMVSMPALSFDSDDVACTEIVVSPTFDRTGFVFVGLSELLGDGTRDFRVIRYRLVADALGEGAAIVGSLSYRGEHAPRFTVDDEDRLYVAMPAAPDSDREPYATHVLKFEADGTVAQDSRAASPIVASGLRSPNDIDWQNDTLWLIGTDERFPESIARLQLGRDEPMWPRPLRHASLPLRNLRVTAFEMTSASRDELDGSVVARALLIDSAHRLYRVEFRDQEAVAITQVSWPGDAVPVDVAIGVSGHTFVVTKGMTGASGIVELKGSQ